MIVGLSAVLISGTVGLLLGLLSGYFGGWIDDVIMRIADIQLSFPTILLALAIMAVLGSGLDKLILVLGLTGWVQYGRIVRSQVLSIKQEEFVLAAKATGEGNGRIVQIDRHRLGRPEQGDRGHDPDIVGAARRPDVGHAGEEPPTAHDAVRRDLGHVAGGESELADKEAWVVLALHECLAIAEL